jgi:diguanylate cyclase (GGDEF)-like protein
VRRLRPSLLTQFSLLSFACILALGVVLSTLLDRELTQRALSDATRQANTLSRVAFAPLLAHEDLSRPIRVGRRGALDTAVAAARKDGSIVRIKVWSRSGQIVYSDEARDIGRRFAVEDDLRGAFAGRTTAGVSELGAAEQVQERRFGHLLEVYVPLRLPGQARPAGAFEIYQSYAPLAAAIGHDTHMAELVLGAGLLFLYAMLFRLVSRASRRLRAQARDRERQALDDPLTGLGSRRRLMEVLDRALGPAGDRPVSLLLLDLNGFKQLNDALGHAAGDRTLRDVATRLAALRGPGVLALCRLGGDEFAVALRGDAAASGTIARSLTSILSQPVRLEELTVAVDGCIGIAIAPEDAATTGELLRCADVAMYEAKRRRVAFERYRPELDGHDAASVTLVAELRDALADGDLVLHYQPKVDLVTRAVTGVEALVRWQHPTRGMLMPGSFVPAAEHTSLMRPLTRHVLDLALAQAAAWRAGGRSWSVAVNVGASDLMHADLAEDVATLLARHAVPASSLRLEITETALISDGERAARTLEELVATGCSISLDDFGSGYSSLTHLRMLPVSEVKLDRSFVSVAATDPSSRAIVESTIALAARLGLRTVAEGVEDDVTLSHMHDAGCTEAQGFGIARPMTARDLERWADAPGLRAA